MGCFRNRTQAEAACVAGGFVVSPNPPTCEDFNEASHVGAAGPQRPGLHGVAGFEPGRQRVPSLVAS